MARGTVKEAMKLCDADFYLGLAAVDEKVAERMEQTGDYDSAKAFRRKAENNLNYALRLAQN